MPEVAIAHLAGTVVTVAQVSGGHDAKSADACERTTLRSPQRVFAIARIVRHFAVTPAGQVQTAREHLARIGASVARIALAFRPSCVLPIAMVGALTSVGPIIVSLTFVMRLGRRTRATSKRQPVVTLIPIAFVSIAVAGVALVAIVAWIEVHHTSAEIVA